MPARRLFNRLMLAWIALCLLVISLLGSVSQVTPIAAASYKTSKDFASPPPILSANPSNFINANHCRANQNQGWQCDTLLTNENSRKSLNWSTSGSGINGITFNPPSGQLFPNEMTLVVVTVPPTTCPANATFNFTGPANTISAPWSCLSPSPSPSPTPSHAPSPTPSPTLTPVPSPTISPSPSSTPSPNPSSILTSPTPDAQSTPAPTVNGIASNGGSGGSSAGIIMTFTAFALAMLTCLLYLLPARHSPAALLKRILVLFVPASFLR